MWFHHELKDRDNKAALTGVAVSDNNNRPIQNTSGVLRPTQVSGL